MIFYKRDKYGIPDFISFDHDFGVDENNNLLPTGYDFAKWLVEQDMNLDYTFPHNFSFYVHSFHFLKYHQVLRTNYHKLLFLMILYSYFYFPLKNLKNLKNLLPKNFDFILYGSIILTIFIEFKFVESICAL